MYSMWKIMCFLNLKPHKHIALHQIHKIMVFLATSYDPFNIYTHTCIVLHYGIYTYIWIYITKYICQIWLHIYIYIYM